MESAELLPGTFPIVCLCGSAGVLQAYKAILHGLPVNTGMTFVLVSHRGPENKNLLLRLLSTKTHMEIVEATDGFRLEPNLVIVAPPHVGITTDGIILKVCPRPKTNRWPTVISDFLRSVAATCGSRSIVVILSGMGYDGSEALGAIKQRGGVTFAQSDCQFDSMPQEAIHTGHVDFVLSAAKIGELLGRYDAQSSQGARPRARRASCQQTSRGWDDLFCRPETKN